MPTTLPFSDEMEQLFCSAYFWGPENVVHFNCALTVDGDTLVPRQDWSKIDAHADKKFATETWWQAKKHASVIDEQIKKQQS